MHDAQKEWKIFLTAQCPPWTKYCLTAQCPTRMEYHSFTSRCQTGSKQLQRGQRGGGERSSIYSGLIVCLVFSKHRLSWPMPSMSQNVRLCVRVSACSSVRLFTFEVPFKRLFAPTSRSWISTIFRDSESSNKSIGMKWSQIWTFLLKNGL